MPYPIIQVPEAAEQLEQLGTKEKFWFLDAQGRMCLFKYARPNTGEDWAEKIAAELCALLGLPHATYELAEHDGRRGVATPNFLPATGRAVFGNELLSFAVAGYDTAPRHRRVHHTLGRVFALLEAGGILPPLGWERPACLKSAASVFVGYLMLDALIGNQDRHDQNWGTIRTSDGLDYLQPTFDHASSLGRLMANEVCAERLASRDANRSPEHYVKNARSALYPLNGTRTLLTLDAFHHAAQRDMDAAGYWLDQLRALQPASMRHLIDEVDDMRMGSASKDFAFQMLLLNQERLLDSLR